MELLLVRVFLEQKADVSEIYDRLKLRRFKRENKLLMGGCLLYFYVQIKRMFSVELCQQCSLSYIVKTAGSAIKMRLKSADGFSEP